MGRRVVGHERFGITSVPWAVTALGPVPGDQPQRLQWQRREAAFAAVMANRAAREAATRGQRRLAIAAAPELRRRYPG